MPFPKICRGCGVPFVADRRKTAFHSRPCYGQWRERTPEWQAAKRRGQQKSAATMHRKTLALYERKAVGCTSKGAAFRDGHRTGYQLGWKRGERIGYGYGFQKGYDQAQRELRFTSVMQRRSA